MTDILQASAMRKGFAGVQALSDVGLRLRGGEIHALLGENGAGKSTLIKILTGVHRPDAGALRLAGQSVQFRSARDAQHAGISVVHQERNLIRRFSIAENITLENPPRRCGFFNRPVAMREAARLLARLGLGLDPALPVSRLSVAQAQMVEIARALYLTARVLLLDEPTSSLTESEVAHLFRVLRALRDRGLAILFVSHKLEEVFSLCERVTVLRDGRNTLDAAPLAGLSRADIVRAMVGREETTLAVPPRPQTSRPMLRVAGLATPLGHRDIDFTLHTGEVLGFYGLVGAGRSELARALMGAVPISAGRVEIDGREVRPFTVSQAVRRLGLAYVSEDRKGEGLILDFAVAANIAAPIWHRLRFPLAQRTEDAVAAPLVARLDVRTPSLSQRVGNLSGGNQQKVSVAKWLAAEARILIIDEPTVGIDIRSKAYLHGLILELARAGTAVIVISSDMPELVMLADRILVMRAFQIVDAFVNDRDYATASVRIMTAIHESAVSPERESAHAD